MYTLSNADLAKWVTVPIQITVRFSVDSVIDGSSRKVVGEMCLDSSSLISVYYAAPSIRRTKSMWRVTEPHQFTRSDRIKVIPTQKPHSRAVRMIPTLFSSAIVYKYHTEDCTTVPHNVSVYCGAYLFQIVFTIPYDDRMSSRYIALIDLDS